MFLHAATAFSFPLQISSAGTTETGHGRQPRWGAGDDEASRSPRAVLACLPKHLTPPACMQQLGDRSVAQRHSCSLPSGWWWFNFGRWAPWPPPSPGAGGNPDDAAAAAYGCQWFPLPPEGHPSMCSSVSALPPPLIRPCSSVTTMLCVHWAVQMVSTINSCDASSSY